MNEEYSYIKDAFTKAEDKTNLEVNNLNVDCITSKNQKFELDSEGNLTVKSIIAETREVNQFTVNSLLANTISSNDNKFNLDNEGNLTVKSIIVENGIRPADILNAVYPVGSIYLSVNVTNPATLFGGTWEQIKDRFLLGCGDIYANGVVGGEAEHILSKNELPKIEAEPDANFVVHQNNDRDAGALKYKYGGKSGSLAAQTGIAYGHVRLEFGGNLPHNNMPPYLTIYMWKRIS